MPAQLMTTQTTLFLHNLEISLVDFTKFPLPFNINNTKFVLSSKASRDRISRTRVPTSFHPFSKGKVSIFSAILGVTSAAIPLASGTRFLFLLFGFRFHTHSQEHVMRRVIGGVTVSAIYKLLFWCSCW